MRSRQLDEAAMRRTRAWFQFRLLTLFAVITAIAVATALFGVRLRRLQVQKNAFDKITAKGGYVHRYGSVTVVSFIPRQSGFMDCFPPDRTYPPGANTEPTFDDRDLEVLDDILELDSIDFAASNVTKPAVWRFDKTHPKCKVSY